MFYEINVSKDGWHLFATADRSITSEERLEEMCTLFVKKFPSKKGYVMSVVQWDKVGEIMSVTDVLERKLKREKGEGK